jgi:hypothetical protein
LAHVNKDRVECPSLVDEPIVRLILDCTVVRVRLDREANSISLLIARVARRLAHPAERRDSAPRHPSGGTQLRFLCVRS